MRSGRCLLGESDHIRSSPVWKRTQHLFKDHWEGPNPKARLYAHNCYLQIMAETGIMEGWFVFYGYYMFVTAWINSLQAYKGYGSRVRRSSVFVVAHFFKALCLAYVVFLVQSFLTTLFMRSNLGCLCG